MQSEVYEAFRDLGATEDKALKAAAVLGKRNEDQTAASTAMKLDITQVRGELLLHRWMLGFILATNVAMLFRLFSL